MYVRMCQNQSCVMVKDSKGIGEIRTYILAQTITHIPAHMFEHTFAYIRAYSVATWAAVVIHIPQYVCIAAYTCTCSPALIR
jgi:hypothetical protein